MTRFGDMIGHLRQTASRPGKVAGCAFRHGADDQTSHEVNQVVDCDLLDDLAASRRIASPDRAAGLLPHFSDAVDQIKYCRPHLPLARNHFDIETLILREDV